MLPEKRKQLEKFIGKEKVQLLLLNKFSDEPLHIKQELEESPWLCYYCLGINEDPITCESCGQPKQEITIDF